MAILAVRSDLTVFRNSESQLPSFSVIRVKCMENFKIASRQPSRTSEFNDIWQLNKTNPAFWVSEKARLKHVSSATETS